MGDEYRRFWIASSTAALRESLIAEAFEAGAEGAEEQDEAPITSGVPAARASAPSPITDARFGFGAWVYARADAIEAIRGQVERALGEHCAASGPGAMEATAGGGIAAIGASQGLPEVDWSEAWKAGLGPIEISARIVVRPPFVDYALSPGQREIVIEPKQAFGTGTHASTRLCLEWLDRLIDAERGGETPARVLDVGTGSGILAFAAVVLGARSALGFDLDPVAIEAAREAAEANGLEERVALVCGPIEAIDVEPAFDVILANLLKRELLPIADEIARRLAPQGSLVLAGLLEEDAAEVAARFAPLGLREAERRVRDDDVGRWIAPRYVRDGGGASDR